MTFNREHLTIKVNNKQVSTMNKNTRILNENGQIVLVLVLVMTVALAIGIAVIQRSLSDVSTASKVEQSSRAFSAAEAGIEKTLSIGTSITTPLSLGNSSQVVSQDTGLTPVVSTVGARQNPLEYFSLSKEDVAQVWFADFNSATNPPAQVYKQSLLDVYWGNSASDPAALELTVIYYGADPSDPVDPATTKYRSKKLYFDQITRSPSNNFDLNSTCTGGIRPANGSNTYQCERLVGLPASPAQLMLLRARLLYNTTSQPFAVQALTCTAAPCQDYSLPSQTRIIQSTGTAGVTQRKIQLQQMYKVAPLYLDYAIFSSDTIAK